MTHRNRTLIVLLDAEAAINAASASSALTEIAPRPVVAFVALLNAMLSASTAVYVSVTQAVPEASRNGLAAATAAYVAATRVEPGLTEQPYPRGKTTP